MTPRQLSAIEDLRLSLEEKTAEMFSREKGKEFPSFVYILSEFSDGFDVKTELMYPFLRDYESKKELIRYIHELCYNDIDDGAEILAVGCIMDVFLSTRLNKEFETEEQHKAWLRDEFKRMQPKDDPDAKDAIYSVLCTKEKVQSWTRLYRIENENVIFQPIKKDNAIMIHHGTFSKLYPPERPPKKVVKVTIVDAAIYEPKFIPMEVYEKMLHMRVLSSLRKDIIQDKSEGKQIILVKFPDHSGIYANVNKSIFDKLISLPEEPTDTMNLMKMLGHHCLSNYGWTMFSDIKIIMGKPHQDIQ